jgi:hypothetical protein
MLAAGAASPWSAILPGGTTPRSPPVFAGLRLRSPLARLRLCGLRLAFLLLAFRLPSARLRPRGCPPAFRVPAALPCPPGPSLAFGVAVSARPFVPARNSLSSRLGRGWPSLVLRAPAALRFPSGCRFLCGTRFRMVSASVWSPSGPTRLRRRTRPPGAAGRPFPFRLRPRLGPGPLSAPLAFGFAGVVGFVGPPITEAWAGWGVCGVQGLGGGGRRSVLGLWRCSGPVRGGSRASGGGPSDGTVRRLPLPRGRGR